jgi:HlyD family secretion protein
MASTTPHQSRSWTWILVAIALVAGTFYLVRATHPPATVRYATVDRENLLSTLSTNGKVEPTQDFQAHAAQPSVVKNLYVHVGDIVRQGQQLLRLDASDAASKVAAAQATADSGELALHNLERGGTSAELLSNQSELDTAQQQQQAAVSTLNMLEALQAKGSASAAEVAQARQRVTDTSAHVAALKSQTMKRYTQQDIATQKAINAANNSALSAAESSYASVDIRAPFAGTVYQVSVKQYEFVQNPAESMLNIADLSKLQVRAYFDEPEIGKLSAGQPVKIVWDAKPSHTWHGHILQAPTTIITYGGTRNVGECIITIDDADGELLPNTNVTVTVMVSEHDNVLSLPREALHTQSMTNFVYKIENGHLVRTKVGVGVVNLTRVEITSGLNQGDIVALGAVSGDTELTDGLHVKTAK